jgi:RimJ/RimL family protein N-acetyltransferase
MIAFGFDELGLDRLQATVLRANAASRRVIERLGFAIEEADLWEEPLYGGPARLADCYMLYRR